MKIELDAPFLKHSKSAQTAVRAVNALLNLKVVLMSGGTVKSRSDIRVSGESATLEIDAAGLTPDLSAYQKKDFATLAYAATVDIDMATAASVNYILLTGTLAITLSNMTAGARTTLYLQANGTNKSWSWPSGWVWVNGQGVSTPTLISGSRSYRVDILCLGTTAAEVRATYFYA